MDEASEVQERRRSLLVQVLRGLGWCVLSVIIYALSIGPAAKLGTALNLQAQHPGVERLGTEIYYPVRLLCERVGVVGDFYEWYLLKVWRLPMRD